MNLNKAIRFQENRLNAKTLSLIQEEKDSIKLLIEAAKFVSRVREGSEDKFPPTLPGETH